MKRVLTYGTFDLLHWGHIRLLKRARSLGDYLIVAASTDDFAVEHKGGRAPYHQFETRCDMLKAVRFVDLVIGESTWEQKVDDIRRYHVDTVVMGGNWEGSPRFEYLRDYCELIYLPRTEGVSTSQIRRDLLADAVALPGHGGHEPAPVTTRLTALPRTA
ncbi:adenylyltransferase/cytidyltransferase family protein [Nesterenkonia muleiensis]|uniref:adenylyltransferase/cytidyltransferase family protein n=1 Tax=Nesterenkonia muleiensis TaxID=2282648 RepID=UPI000E74FD5B